MNVYTTIVMALSIFAIVGAFLVPVLALMGPQR